MRDKMEKLLEKALSKLPGVKVLEKKFISVNPPRLVAKVYQENCCYPFPLGIKGEVFVVAEDYGIKGFFTLLIEGEETSEELEGEYNNGNWDIWWLR